MPDIRPVFQLPQPFILGVADADLQVVGEEQCRAAEHSEETLWTAFARSGKTWNSQGPGRGIDRYNLWAEDTDLMVSLGIRHFRTSVSMARILKKDGSINEEAVTWYRAFFGYLKAKGISLYVTLYHWELPEYLSQLGGWTNPAIVDFMVRYALIVQERLGDLIDQYFTVNEPWCVSHLGFHEGVFPPGEKNFGKALIAAHHLLLTSGRMVRALLAKDPKVKIGIVLNLSHTYAFSTKPEDQAARDLADCYMNRWFLDPIFLGRYPDQARSAYGSAWPNVSEAEMEIIKVGPLMHALGINYYSGGFVKCATDSEFGYKPVYLHGILQTGLGWSIFAEPHLPNALHDLLVAVHARYEYGGLKKIYISENGMALPSSFSGKGELMPDGPRIEYFKKHLQQVFSARLAGVPVEGYFAWTFMDNYEWAEGYRPESCFGLVHVDRTTFKRTPKASAHWYSELAKSGLFPY